jgi:hypothetical protein
MIIISQPGYLYIRTQKKNLILILQGGLKDKRSVSKWGNGVKLKCAIAWLIKLVSFS